MEVGAYGAEITSAVTEAAPKLPPSSSAIPQRGSLSGSTIRSDTHYRNMRLAGEQGPVGKMAGAINPGGLLAAKSAPEAGL